MVRNVIEDSDEESDLGAPSPVANEQGSPAPARLQHDETAARSQKSLPGTGSTEELRREIAAAHRDLIDKSAAPDGTTESLESTSSLPWDSPTGPRKRKFTLSSLDHRTSPPAKRLDRRESAKTYGRPDGKTHGPIGGDGDAYEALRHDMIHNAKDNNAAIRQLSGEEPPTPTSEEHLAARRQASPLELPSSIRKDFAGHEPAVMFPMTMSSTIPDGTADQQRLLEVARAEDQQDQWSGSPRSAAKSFENPSVSWSELLESNEKAMQSSHSNSEKSQQRSHVQTGRSRSLQQATSCDPRSQPLDIGNHPSPQLGSSGSAAKRSKTTPCSRTHRSFYDELGEHDELGAESLPGTNTTPSLRERSLPNGERSTDPQRLIEDSVNESIRAVRDLKARKAQEVHVDEPLSNDDAAAGVPKERFVPRPSRSRSVRSSIDGPDYSEISEQAAREKAKHRKPEEVTVVQDDDGAQPDTATGTEASMSATGGSTARPVEVGLFPVSEQAQSNAPTQKRKRGRPPKKRKECSKAVSGEPHAGLPKECGVDEADKPHQAMPSVGGEAIDQAEQLLHDPDFKDDGLRARQPSPIVQPTPASSAQADGEPQQAEGPKRRRRGRGRPRSTPMSGEGRAGDDVDELQTATEAVLQDENERSHEMQPDAGWVESESHDFQKAEEGAEKATTLGNAGKAAPALGTSRSPQEPSEEHEAAAAAAAAAPAPARAGLTEPSPPGTKGKAPPVRVGLSRRVRIAPLLKIVKK